MMFDLRIDLVFFNFMRREAASCCSVANMNGQMGDGQVELASMLLGRIVEVAK